MDQNPPTSPSGSEPMGVNEEQVPASPPQVGTPPPPQVSQPSEPPASPIPPLPAEPPPPPPPQLPAEQPPQEIPASQGPVPSMPPETMQASQPPPPPPPPPQSLEPPLTSQPQTQPISSFASLGADEPGPKRSWFTSRFILAPLIILLAAGLVGGILFVLQSGREEEPLVTPPPTAVEEPKAFTLSLEAPKDGTVVDSKETVVKGKTSPNTLVVFFTDTSDESVESDEQGNFQGKITLASGINTLTAVAISPDGEEKIETRDIVYDGE